MGLVSWSVVATSTEQTQGTQFGSTVTCPVKRAVFLFQTPKEYSIMCDWRVKPLYDRKPSYLVPISGIATAGSVAPTDGPHFRMSPRPITLLLNKRGKIEQLKMSDEG